MDKKRPIVLLILLSFLLTSGSAYSTASAEKAFTPNLEAAQSYLETQMRRHRFKGMAVAITQGEDIVYLNGFGSAGSSRPVTTDTPFFIGSVSKSFTALAVMQLVDQGLVDLDAPVQTYLPWFTTADGTAASQITIRHLLNQTSGMSNASLRRPLVTEETTLEETVRHLSQAELTSPPGTAFNYFNPNYNVLALVVAEVTGVKFEDYLAENVFEPLEMTHSFTELEPARQAGLADGHIFFFGFPLTREQPLYLAELPAGFMISTAEDMAHYMIALINGGTFHQKPLLSPEAIQIMHTPQPGVQGGYAMGWSVHDKDGYQLIRHNGAVEAFYSEVLLLPDQEIGITLLINQNAFIPVGFTFGPFADGLVDALLGNQPSLGIPLSLVYGILAVIVIYDLVSHVIALKRVPKWWQKVAGKSRARIIIGVVLSHLLIPAVVIFFVVMMMVTAGLNAARITLYYYMFDIALWLTISIVLSLVEAVIKLRWVVGYHSAGQPMP
ncbi:MAG: serine hydrolase domain-containing protein [Brevefilum sp.]